MRAGDVHRVPDAVDCEERADALVPPLARLAVHLIQADAAGGGVGNQVVHVGGGKAAGEGLAGARGQVGVAERAKRAGSHNRAGRLQLDGRTLCIVSRGRGPLRPRFRLFQAAMDPPSTIPDAVAPRQD